ncbi:MAG TPA: PQQ-dependent sugar dehydrogenase [Candidatus Kapabacteria bacterium]
MKVTYSSLLRSICTCFVLVLTFLFAAPSEAQRIDYTTRDVAVGLNVPWEIRWGHDGWIWFTERAGYFKKVHPDSGIVKNLLFEPEVHSLAEWGLLGFDFHPDFPNTPFIYIAYTYADSISQADTILYWEKVVRYTYTPDTLTDKHTIFDKIRAYDAHNGARVVVGPDRKLYVSTGETYYSPELAQMDESPNGKILRLNLDGSIPDDNPWAGSPVWTKGHRNPQGLTFGSDGTLYESEHGDFTDDEVNIIERGRNYGWDMVQGFCDKPEEMSICNDSNVVEPLINWTPTIAPSGMELYEHDRFPEWKNSLLLTSLKDESLWQLILDSAKKKIIGWQKYHIELTLPDSTTAFARRLRDVCFSPDGRIFVSTSNIWSPEWRPDRIFEIIRTGVSHVRDNERKAFNAVASPNPAIEKITISNLPPNRTTIELIDQLGRTVFSSITSSNEATISLQTITRGAYYVRIMSDGGIQTIPVIIK